MSESVSWIILCYFHPGYGQALAQFVLKKFLYLIYFLDRAKLTRLIDHDPCLFCRDAEIKVHTTSKPPLLYVLYICMSVYF